MANGKLSSNIMPCGFNRMASFTTLDFGGAKRDRTADLLTASQALSQLSYSPTNCVPPLAGTFLIILRRCNPVNAKQGCALGMKLGT